MYEIIWFKNHLNINPKATNEALTVQLSLTRWGRPNYRLQFFVKDICVLATSLNWVRLKLHYTMYAKDVNTTSYHGNSNTGVFYRYIMLS